jgi:hypothetical protein
MPTGNPNKKPKSKRVKRREIDPTYLSIQETPSGPRLCLDEQPLLLLDGSPLCHPRPSLLEHIREEFSGFGTITLDTQGKVLKPDIISSYRLLAVQRSLEAAPQHPFLKDFQIWLLLDPCLRPCAGPEITDQLARWHPLTRFFDDLKLTAPSLPQIQFELEDTDDVESILSKYWGGVSDPGDVDYVASVKAFLGSVHDVFKKLGPEEWAVMYALFQCHNAVLFPLLLVTGRCTAQEYANGLMAAHLLLTTVLSEVTPADHAAQTEGFRKDAEVMLQFLEHARCPWAKEINQGESTTREFKATLRYDLQTQQHNKLVELAVIKNVAAFLNANGGSIFVGVADNRDIVGIDPDGFENTDKWQLHLVNRIGHLIGKSFLPLCSIDFGSLHGKTVARVTVQRSGEPAFLNETALKPNGDPKAFYVRGGPSAQKLNPEETRQYTAEHFPTRAGGHPTP